MTRRARLLGSPRLEGDAQRCPQPRGLKSWAVLARVALAERGIERHELAGELFGEADAIALDAFFVYPEELKSVARQNHPES